MSAGEPPLRPLAYRPKEAAAMLGIGRTTLYRMIAEGQIAARKIGGSTIIALAELERVLEVAPLAGTKATELP